MKPHIAPSRPRLLATGVLSALLAVVGVSSAALPDPGKLLTCTLSEKVTEAVVSGAVVTTSTTNVSVSMALGQYDFEGGGAMNMLVMPIDLDTITEDTAYALTIGGLTWEGTLADDPNIAVNLPKKSVFIPVNFNALTGKPVGTSGIKIVWTSTKVTITVVRSSLDQDDHGSALADTLRDMDEPGGSAISVIDQLPIEITFGDFSGEDIFGNNMPCFIKGTAAVTIKKVGTGMDAEEFNLNAISLTGVLDTALPTLTVAMPTGGFTAADGSVTLTGKAADAYGIRSIRYQDDLFVLGGEITDTTQVKGPPTGAGEGWWGPTEQTWRLELTELPYGETYLDVIVEDTSGNEKSIPVKLIRRLPDMLTGRWDALLDAEIPGYLTFTVTNTGAVSGSIRLSGMAAAKPVKGSWSDRNFYAHTDRGKDSEIYIFAEVVEGTDTDVASLRMSINAETYDEEGESTTFSGEAFRAPFTSTNKLSVGSPLLGIFNGQMNGNPGYPTGYGHFSMVTSNLGINAISGRLPDGTTYTSSAAVGAEGQMPFFVSLYGNKGYFYTFQQVDMESGEFPAAEVVWSRPMDLADKQFPDGIDMFVNTSVARYTAPLKNTRILGLSDANALAWWIGDGVDEGVEQALLVSLSNVITPNGASPAFKATFAAKTGIITGSFMLPTTPAAKASYSAIIVGDQVFGHYIAPAPVGATQKRYGYFDITAQ